MIYLDVSNHTILIDGLIYSKWNMIRKNNVVHENLTGNMSWHFYLKQELVWKFSLLKWLFWSNCKINWWHELNLCINQIILKWYPTPFLSIFSLNSNSIVQSGCEILVIITNYSSKENVASKAFSSRKVVVGV